MITRRDVVGGLAAGAAVATSGFAPQAIARPLAKTVHVLTGFTPGFQDAMARLVTDQMKGYAETIVVESRPGAAGRIAVEAAKNADADGSTMLFSPLGFLMFFPHVYKTLRYTPGDFTPVSTVASTPTLLMVGPKVSAGVRTLADFVAWCKANSKQATFGAPGPGTTLHFLGTMLGRTAGFEYQYVPYQGGAAIQDLLKGEIASTLMPVGSAVSFVQSGHLRALATTGPRRCPFVPDVPTMAEAGFPSLQDLTWFGFFVPAKTPTDIVERLNNAIQAALRSEQVKAGMENLAVEIDAISLGDFARLVASESERWKGIVQATGFTPMD